MKFSLTTEVKCSTSPDALEMLQLKSELLTAYENLDASIKGMEEVSTLMDNIQTSLNLIDAYKQDAIPQLNIDGGLEALLGIPERLITVEKAMEELEEQKKSLWQKFVAICRKVFHAIAGFLKSLFNSPGGVWDGEHLETLKAMVMTSEYNHLWAGNFSKFTEGYKYDHDSSGKVITKVGFEKICAFFDQLIPKYLEYEKVILGEAKKFSSGSSDDQINASVKIVSDARDKFTNWLMTTPLKQTMTDGKPYIADDVTLFVGEAVYAGDDVTCKDAGWSSKNDVLSTIDNMFRLRSTTERVDEAIDLIGDLDNHILQLMESNPIQNLHNLFDTTKCQTVDFTKLMRQVSFIYNAMVNQLKVLVKSFYNSMQEQ